MKLILKSILALAIAGSPLLAGQEPQEEKPKQEEKKETPKPKPEAKPKQEPAPEDKTKPKQEPKPKPDDKQHKRPTRTDRNKKKNNQKRTLHLTSGVNKLRNAERGARSRSHRNDSVPASEENTIFMWHLTNKGSNTVATALKLSRCGQRGGHLMMTATLKRTPTTTTWWTSFIPSCAC